MTLFKRPIHLKTVSGLLIIFLLGSALLFLIYYGLSLKTLKENTTLKAEIVQLDHDIESLATQRVRLSKAPIPSKEELLQYAKMVPADREIPRFLYNIDRIVKGTGLQLLSLQINETQPLSSDLLDKLLVFLEERSESLPALTNYQQREDFIGNLLAQMDDQYADAADGNNTSAAPVDEGSLKRVLLHLELNATDLQFYQFLTQVRELERMTYVDNIQFGTTTASLDLTIFYYEGDYSFIPKLP